MTPFNRRALLAAAGTVAALGVARKPLAAGAMQDLAALRPARKDMAVPEIRFTAADGAARTLADYAGQGVVLNLWATWCPPCVAEMPALDELARDLRAERVAVLALSSDRGGAAVVERFYKDRGIRDLSVLLDPRGDAARALGVRGLPTTLVIDRKGRERARVEGPADWAAPASVRAIRDLVG